MSLKRPPSPCDRDDKSPKRRAVEPINVADDDLEAILLQIEQQEESEALARRLQAEWDNDPGESSHGPRGGPHSPIMIEDEESNVIENDEALAKRLAAEWAREDSTAAHNAPSGQSSQMANHGQSCTNTKCKGKTSPLDATPDIVLEDYRDFFVGPRNCTKCNHEIISPRGFVTYSTQIPPPSLLALLHVLCPDCQTVFCRGCSRVLPCPTSCRGMGKDKSPICPVWTCCAEVRAIALFEALGGFDRHYIGERATSASRSKEAMQRYRSTGSKSVGPGGTGYGTGYDGGYGHGGSGNGGSRGRGGGRSQHVESGPSWLMGLAAHADVVVVRALTTITQLLPAPYSDSPHDYDMIPHATTATLILASHLPELLASLLRNDSVTDWTSRSDVYNAMLGLLRRMSDCELTLEVIIGERHEMEKSGGLEEWMWGDTEISWVMSGEEMVKLNSLYSHFQKLTKQCEAFLSGASQMLESGEEPNEDVESIIKSTSLCGEIIAARDDLERAMKAMNRDSTHTQSDSQSSTCVSDGSKKRQTDQASNDALVKKYANECERLAFHHVSFPQKGGNYSTFNFANLVTSTASSTRNPKDRLHLIKELAVMATSLPPGVWVRVDEVRNDVLKIMIAGPEGTPYAGGLFEFDCFLPLEYPHKPPLMHLRTTGGGSVRFNPNLYNNGKVCLSLLGTWPGRPEEQWTSKSTLLQVLVSIQSMILVDLPYFNEPGFGNANPTHRQSIAYNRNIAVQTVRWAMVEWLKDEHKTSMWADVIKTHFSLLSPKITQSIEKWAAEEPRMKAYTPNQHGARGHIPGPGIFTQAMIPPMATAHLTQTMGIANGINAAGAAMTHNSGPPGNSANGSRSGSAQAGGINLLEEFSKGLRVVEAWSAGTYTSP